LLPAHWQGGNLAQAVAAGRVVLLDGLTPRGAAADADLPATPLPPLADGVDAVLRAVADAAAGAAGATVVVDDVLPLLVHGWTVADALVFLDGCAALAAAGGVRPARPSHKRNLAFGRMLTASHVL